MTLKNAGLKTTISRLCQPSAG